MTYPSVPFRSAPPPPPRRGCWAVWLVIGFVIITVCCFCGFIAAFKPDAVSRLVHSIFG